MHATILHSFEYNINKVLLGKTLWKKEGEKSKSKRGGGEHYERYTIVFRGMVELLNLFDSFFTFLTLLLRSYCSEIPQESKSKGEAKGNGE